MSISEYLKRPIVEELANFGARVHTCARDEEELSRCQEWKAKGLGVTVSVSDVSVRADREALAATARELFGGKLNILVNNAEASYLKPAVETTPEECSQVMAINFESCFHLSQLAHPLLKASGSGSIVFISSVASFLGVSALSIYSATRGAINQVTKNLAAEWACDGIRVNCVAPGIIMTPLHVEFLKGNNFLQEEVPLIPMRRVSDPKRSPL